MFSDLIPLGSVEIFLCVSILFIAYVIKGMSGFGSGLIAIPLLALLLPLTLVVPILALLSYSGTVYQGVSFRRDASWKDLLPLLPFSLLGVIAALWILVNVNVNILTFALGVFIFCYAIYSLLPLTKLTGSRYWAIVAGSLAGFIGALFGTGGPFYVLYLKMRQLNKQQFRATISMIFLFDGGIRMSGYIVSGLFTEKMLWLALILFPVLFTAMYVGNHLHIKINEHRFNLVISVLLLVSGLGLVIKSTYLMA